MRWWRCRCIARACASAATTKRKRSRVLWRASSDCRRSTRGVARRIATPTQTGQGAAERRASVAHAFRVARDLTGQRIAIVDDVVTTGATVNALAAELRAAGAARCVVLPSHERPLVVPDGGAPEPAQGRNV